MGDGAKRDNETNKGGGENTHCEKKKDGKEERSDAGIGDRKKHRNQEKKNGEVGEEAGKETRSEGGDHGGKKDSEENEDGEAKKKRKIVKDEKNKKQEKGDGGDNLAKFPVSMRLCKSLAAYEKLEERQLHHPHPSNQAKPRILWTRQSLPRNASSLKDKVIFRKSLLAALLPCCP